MSVTGSIAPRVRHVTVQPDHVVFTPGQTLDLTGRNPWTVTAPPQGGSAQTAGRGALVSMHVFAMAIG